MDPIFDPNGSTVGWVSQGRVLNRHANTIGVVRDGAVYDNRGVQRGRYERGYFRDLSGNAVAFTQGATGGPIQPVPQVPPVPPVPSVPPVPAVPQVPSVPAIPSFSWSAATFASVFE